MADITVKRARWWELGNLYGLYLSAFPARERKPFGVIVRMAKEGRADPWTIRCNGVLAGLAATVNSPELVLLDYLAVTRTYRGRGVGTAAMENLMAQYPALLVEIESTREDCGNSAEREKRKQFYVNCGMTPLDVEADLFGVRMELLGYRCRLDFEGYRSFYCRYYSPRAAEHVRPAQL